MRLRFIPKGVFYSPKDRFNFNKTTDNRLFSQKVMMSSQTLHDGNVTIKVSKSGKVLQAKTFDIAVRSAYPQTYVRHMDRLAAYTRLEINKDINQSIWSDIHTLSLRLSAKALLPTESMKDELIQYQGRCAEQTTSRAMPWLFAHNPPEQSDLITSAIERLLAYQI
ncbi:MAG: hypothetical protein Q9M36_12555 [Sulfurovum sp.]|nr:hypothetical protein [Sulfurovum sp.]